MIEVIGNWRFFVAVLPKRWINRIFEAPFRIRPCSVVLYGKCVHDRPQGVIGREFPDEFERSKALGLKENKS